MAVDVIFFGVEATDFSDLLDFFAETFAFDTDFFATAFFEEAIFFVVESDFVVFFDVLFEGTFFLILSSFNSFVFDGLFYPPM